MKPYIVNAFTGGPFAGNPAAVCVMDSLPEAAFIAKEPAAESNPGEMTA